MIRTAQPHDAEGILEIYKPYISNTSTTFETEVPSVEAFSQRIVTYLERWPWLVFELEGMIAGYAYAGGYRERIAYQWSVESSIYIHDKFMGKRIGAALYNALFQILQYQGFRNIYAVINLPNDPSVIFHEKFGFIWFANYENVGYKLGEWKTVGWWLKQLNPYSKEPKPPIRFSDVSPAIVNSLIEK